MLYFGPPLRHRSGFHGCRFAPQYIMRHHNAIKEAAVAATSGCPCRDPNRLHRLGIHPNMYPATADVARGDDKKNVREPSDRRPETLMDKLAAEKRAAEERRKRKLARALAAFPGHWTLQHILDKRRWPSFDYVRDRLSAPDISIGHFCDGNIDLYSATRVRSVEADDDRLQSIRTDEAQRIRVRRRVAQETRRNPRPVAGEEALQDRHPQPIARGKAWLKGYDAARRKMILNPYPRNSDEGRLWISGF